MRGIQPESRRAARNRHIYLRVDDILAHPADELVALAGRNWQFDFFLHRVGDVLHPVAAALAQFDEVRNNPPKCDIRPIPRRARRDDNLRLRAVDTIAYPAHELVALALRGRQLNRVGFYRVGNRGQILAAVRAQRDGVGDYLPVRGIRLIARCPLRQHNRWLRRGFALARPAEERITRAGRRRQDDRRFHRVGNGIKRIAAAYVQRDGVFNHLPIRGVSAVARASLRDFNGFLRFGDALARPAEEDVARANRGRQLERFRFHRVLDGADRIAACRVHRDGIKLVRRQRQGQRRVGHEEGNRVVPLADTQGNSRVALENVDAAIARCGRDLHRHLLTRAAQQVVALRRHVAAPEDVLRVDGHALRVRRPRQRNDALFFTPRYGQECGRLLAAQSRQVNEGTLVRAEVAALELRHPLAALLIEGEARHGAAAQGQARREVIRARAADANAVGDAPVLLAIAVDVHREFRYQRAVIRQRERNIALAGEIDIIFRHSKAGFAAIQAVDLAPRVCAAHFRQQHILLLQIRILLRKRRLDAVHHVDRAHRAAVARVLHRRFGQQRAVPIRRFQLHVLGALVNKAEAHGQADFLLHLQLAAHMQLLPRHKRVLARIQHNIARRQRVIRQVHEVRRNPDIEIHRLVHHDGGADIALAVQRHIPRRAQNQLLNICRRADVQPHVLVRQHIQAVDFAGRQIGVQPAENQQIAVHFRRIELRVAQMVKNRVADEGFRRLRVLIQHGDAKLLDVLLKRRVIPVRIVPYASADFFRQPLQRRVPALWCLVLVDGVQCVQRTHVVFHNHGRRCCTRPNDAA